MTLKVAGRPGIKSDWLKLRFQTLSNNRDLNQLGHECHQRRLLDFSFLCMYISLVSFYFAWRCANMKRRFSSGTEIIYTLLFHFPRKPENWGFQEASWRHSYLKSLYSVIKCIVLKRSPWRSRSCCFSLSVFQQRWIRLNKLYKHYK